MQFRVSVRIAALLCVTACADGPTDPIAALPREIRSFLLSQPSLVVRSSEVVLADQPTDITVFRVTYGEPQDCFSGCFYLSAIGARVGSQTGWMPQIGPAPTPAVFRVEPKDSARFSAALLDELKARDLSAFSAVAFALACSANTAAAVREKLVRENPNLPVPLYCPKAS